jgi:hypothetical protein
MHSKSASESSEVSPNTPIARLPKNEWEPLVLALSNLLSLLHEGKLEDFLVKFEFGDVSPPPYVGAKDVEGDLVLMFPGDKYLNPDLTKLQKSQLDGLGWVAPRGGQANYSKFIEGKLGFQASAMYLVATLRLVFEVPVSANFVVTNSEVTNLAMTSAGLELVDGETNVYKIP